MNLRRFLIDVVVFTGAIVITCSTAFAQEARGALFAVLSGGNGVDTETGEAGAGDRNGHGSATVIIVGRDTLCYGVTVNRIDPPTAMHIHQAAAGINGPVVVSLTPPATGSPGASSDCISSTDAMLLSKIRNKPANFYVNVHNPAFPNGAVRGQLH